ncbi:MAG TPA: transaldolase family protein [Acidimicrobiales bacterium]|nr:transaldolase family protein [Acidimicrobiales bacterium]
MTKLQRLHTEYDQSPWLDNITRRYLRCSVEDAYWELVVTDVSDALATLRAVFDSSGGTDGFVSVEVAPELASDTAATITAARELHKRINEPNLFVKIPATAEGASAIEAMIAEGRSTNITLIFSLARYAQVIEAYLAGLEALGLALETRGVAGFHASFQRVLAALEAKSYRPGR